MVHRKEAFHVGEFGMVGIDNAKFWSNQVAQSGGESNLPQKELQDMVKDIAAKRTADDSRVQEWSDRIVKSGQNLDHRAIHDLAMTVLKEKDQRESATLRDFAEELIESEMRILLLHSLEKAGFKVEEETVWNTSSK
jgi:hypothetical protein